MICRCLEPSVVAFSEANGAPSLDYSGHFHLGLVCTEGEPCSQLLLCSHGYYFDKTVYRPLRCILIGALRITILQNKYPWSQQKAANNTSHIIIFHWYTFIGTIKFIEEILLALYCYPFDNHLCNLLRRR